ncbi:hypothetical protein PC117_g25440 [Phytophthora cactorum]|uniref:DUF6818 domain-containing protein n=1 Tax=Phytophthora cactorum TaxID=29920 RepID=A0A8T1ASV9_9STRA|nr:hypothetical protein PC117_g25440 [Phytophthora cactorum]
MGKPTGSTNHSLPEMYQMLDIVKRILPQGKDYWDTFKALNGTRKPTGNPNIPGHVRLAKDVKKLINDASSVFLASDAEDENEVDVNDFRVSRGRRSDRGGPSSGESAELYAGSDQVDESDAADDDFNQLDSLVYTYIDSTESAGAREKLRYPDLAESSGRLCGVNLAAMRDGSKMRTYDEFEEASYTKQKRIKVMLKKGCRRPETETSPRHPKLRRQEDRARGGGAAEAKGAAERDARDERRREERREEREAAEERRRIDREESRAHMREMMMMLSA